MDMQSTEVAFIAFEPSGLMSRETWTATRAFCPRCGASEGAVWALTSTPPMQVGNLQTRVFLCVGCRFVAFGLNGFEPAWDVTSRLRQVVKLGFGVDLPEEEPSTPKLIV